MSRTIIECALCPCRFFKQADFDGHMRMFTDDPVVHIRRYVRGMSYPKKVKRERGQELYDKYLTGRGVKPRPRPKRAKRPKRKAPSPEQIQRKYAEKLRLFRANYCQPGRHVNTPPSKPPLPGSWLARKMDEADR